MQLFLFAIVGLYVLSWIKRNKGISYPFDKDKSLYLKGILSLIIIAFHIQYHTPNIRILLLFGSWGAPVVSLFFFIAGYGLMASYLAKGRVYLTGFFQKRIWKIVKPYLIITLLYTGLSYWDTGNVSATLLHDLILKGATPASWFVLSIIVFYLFFYVIFRFDISMKWKLFYYFILSSVYWAIMMYAGYERCWWVTTYSLLTGLIYRCYEPFFIAFFRKRIVWAGFIPAGCVLLYVLSRCGIEWLLPAAYIIIPLMVIPLISYWQFPQSKVLGFLGAVSYEIYLFHAIYIGLLRGDKVNVTSDYTYVLLTCVLTILSAWCLNKGLSYFKKESR